VEIVDASLLAPTVKATAHSRAQGAPSVQASKARSTAAGCAARMMCGIEPVVVPHERRVATGHHHRAEFQEPQHEMRAPPALSKAEKPRRQREQYTAQCIECEVHPKWNHLDEANLITGEDAINQGRNTERDRHLAFRTGRIQVEKPGREDEDESNDVIEHSMRAG
jgi:hypothetical protein